MDTTFIVLLNKRYLLVGMSFSWKINSSRKETVGGILNLWKFRIYKSIKKLLNVCARSQSWLIHIILLGHDFVLNGHLYYHSYFIYPWIIQEINKMMTHILKELKIWDMCHWWLIFKLLLIIGSSWGWWLIRID